MKKKTKLIKAREIALNAKVGTTITCPSCSTSFVKERYNSIFCKTKGKTVCKDYFWNNVDEKKRKNTTRISPANARYYTNHILPEEARKRGFPDVETMLNYNPDDDGSWESGGNVYVENCSGCDLKLEYCRCENY